MIFECKSFEEFKKKLDAVEQLGLDYQIQKRTSIAVETVGAALTIPVPRQTWAIEAKEVR